MTHIRTHAQIIDDAGGPAAIGEIVDVPGNTTKQWKRNDSIPGHYWAAIAGAGKASLEELAAAAAAKRTGSRESAEARPAA